MCIAKLSIRISEGVVVELMTAYIGRLRSHGGAESLSTPQKGEDGDMVEFLHRERIWLDQYHFVTPSEFAMSPRAAVFTLEFRDVVAA